MTKNFCDLCGNELSAPAPRQRKAQYVVGQTGGMLSQASANTPKIGVEITFCGEFCESCQEKVTAKMQLDFVLQRGMSKKMVG